MYLELSNLKKTFGTFTAVSDVSLSIAKNEFVALLGPSGSGKSTLLRLIAGLEQPTGGSIVVDGTDVTRLPPYQRGIAMVFQDFLLFPHMTVRENLAFPLRMLKMSTADQSERIAWCSTILSLTELQHRYPNQLSGGQQQRVALGRGLVSRPKVLLLDEPLANLDRELRRDMEIEIRRYQIELGIPFIYVTHNQEEALSMSDRIAVVNKGEIEDFSDKGTIYSKPKTSFIAQFVGRSNMFSGPVVRSPTGAKVIQWQALSIPLHATDKLGEHSTASAYIKIEDTLIESDNGVSAPDKIRGRLRDIIFRGQYAEYLVRMPNGAEIIASNIDSATRVTPGDNVLISWDPEKLDLFPGEVRQ